MTSEMAFIESLLLQKRHFLSSKRGRLFKKYFFSFCNWGTLAQKKGTFFTFKKSGGHMPPLPPGSAATGPWVPGWSISHLKYCNFAGAHNVHCWLSRNLRDTACISMHIIDAYSQKFKMAELIRYSGWSKKKTVTVATPQNI